MTYRPERTYYSAAVQPGLTDPLAGAIARQAVERFEATVRFNATVAYNRAAAKARRAADAARSASSQRSGGASGRCGGDLPPCHVMTRESGGNPRAYNAAGCGGYGCGGKWQFDPRTWAGYGGYAEAQDAPESVQDDRARQVWASGAGCGNWSAC